MILHFWRAARVGCFSLLLGAAAVRGANENPDRVSVLSVAGDAQAAKAAIGADGSIHLLMDSARGPRYLKSSDAGRTFSSPIEVVDAASLKPGLIFAISDLAVGRNGLVHVAMSNNAWKLKLPQEEWGFYYAVLAPGATAFSPVRNLNRTPSEGFSLAANEAGSVSAWFLSGKLYRMNSHDDGGSFSAYTEANPAWSPCECCTTAAAYGADGRLAVLYRERTDNERNIFVVVADAGASPRLARRRVSATNWKVDACPMTYFSIQPAGGGYVAAWPTKGQVYFARLDPEGRVLPPGEIRTPGTSGMRTGVLALAAADGCTLVSWKNGNVLGWQLYDAQNQPIGSPGSTNSLGGGAAGVTLRDGRFVLFR